MDYLLENRNTPCPETNYKISCNKLKEELKHYLDLISIISLCHGIQRMDNLVKIQLERLLLMKLLSILNKYQDRMFIILRRSRKHYWENQSKNNHTN